MFAVPPKLIEAVLWLPYVAWSVFSAAGVVAAIRAVAERLRFLSMALSALADVALKLRVAVKLRVVAEPTVLSKLEVVPRRERRNDFGDRVASAVAMSS